MPERKGSVALQRCDQFVGRTENWLYEFLCHVPSYRLIVLCQNLINRTEFPKLEAWSVNSRSLTRRLWRRLMKGHVYPTDWWRLSRVAPMVLHSHFGTTALEDYELWKSLNVPWVVSFYGADIYQRGDWQQHYGSLFEKCEFVLVLGPRMKAELEKRGCPAKKVVICPLGVNADASPVKIRELKDGEILKVLFAGTFRQKKGIEYVIAAAELLKRRRVGFEMHLVGDAAGKEGDQETKTTVFRMINQSDLTDEITHHSWVSHKQLINLALDCHVFVGPSVTASDGDSEGTPFVLQQMMATGMPCIATMHSDIPYIYGDHANLLLPERDGKAIADRLEGYVANPRLLGLHGIALRDQIRTHFDIRNCAVRLSEIYDQVA